MASQYTSKVPQADLSRFIVYCYGKLIWGMIALRSRLIA